MPTFKIKRVYDQPAEADGWRVLVDRLWPRGLSKERAALDHWAKEVAPSDELRKDFHGGLLVFEKFSLRYQAELKQNPELEKLREAAGAHEAVTLLYASRNKEQNHARLLRDFLMGFE